MFIFWLHNSLENNSRIRNALITDWIYFLLWVVYEIRISDNCCLMIIPYWNKSVNSRESYHNLLQHQSLTMLPNNFLIFITIGNLILTTLNHLRLYSYDLSQYAPALSISKSVSVIVHINIEYKFWSKENLL